MRLAIISSIILIYIWIWVINSFFSDTQKFHLTGKIFLLGGILVGSLFGYSYFLSRLGYPQFTLQASIQRPQLGLFVGYCSTLLLIIGLFFHKKLSDLLVFLIVGALFFVAVGSIGILSGMSILLLFILISAFAEEYLKYGSGKSLLLSSESTSSRDIIFFCLLIGLGFSIIENLLYLGMSIWRHETINLMSLIIGRGLVSTLLHLVATGLIGWIVFHLGSKRFMQSIGAPIIGLGAGRGIHSLYNIGLQMQRTYLTIPLVFFLFFLLSYFIFQSDLIYKKSE